MDSELGKLQRQSLADPEDFRAKSCLDVAQKRAGTTFRWAILSDVCANLEALEAVLEHIRQQGIRKIVCLGGVIGYGPDPISCAKLIREHTRFCLKGLSESFLFGDLGILTSQSNRLKTLAWKRELLFGLKCVPEYSSLPVLKDSWTFKIRRALNQELNKRWNFFNSLQWYREEGELQFVYGSPVFDYVDRIHRSSSQSDIEKAMASIHSLAFVSGAWKPFVVRNQEQVEIPVEGKWFPRTFERTLIGVGAVGRPLDGDFRACYVELEATRWRWHRIHYDNKKTAAKIFENPYLNNRWGENILSGCL